MVRAWWFVLLAAGCGLTARDGQFLCPDGACPSGFACVAGVCRTAQDAAGFDAPAVDAAGSDAPGTDAPGTDVPGLDAPGMDAPGMDAPGLDAPPPDAPALDAPAPDAGGPACATDGGGAVSDAPFAADVMLSAETCVPGPGRRAIDENGDGRIDEGCAYYFASPHVVLPAMPVPAEYGGVDLTSDGTTLVTVTSRVAEPVHFARRASLALPFANALPEASLALADRSLDAATIRGDGAELIVEATGADGVSRLYRSARCGTGWLELAPLAETVDAAAEEGEPYLRRDGLELVFVRRTLFPAPSSTIHRARRASLDGAWSMGEALFVGTAPTLSADGFTLYYTDVDGLLRRSEREDLGATFDASTAPALVHPTPLRAMSHLVVLPATREAFFSHRGTGTTPPPDAPRTRSIFRMQVCRDAACTRAVLGGCAGSLSADQLHCYVATGPSTAYGGVTCATGHPVSVHSVNEAGFARSVVSNGWLGIRGRTWESGEPYVYEEFATDPVAMECATVASGWPLVDCVSPTRRGICETELWPVFASP